MPASAHAARSLRAATSPLAVAAYNAGARRVEEAGGIPNIAETREYLGRVLRYRARLPAGGRGCPAGPCADVVQARRSRLPSLPNLLIAVPHRRSFRCWWSSAHGRDRGRARSPPRCFVVACITDFFDGWLARRQRHHHGARPVPRPARRQADRHRGADHARRRAARAARAGVDGGGDRAAASSPSPACAASPRSERHRRAGAGARQVQDDLPDVRAGRRCSVHYPLPDPGHVGWRSTSTPAAWVPVDRARRSPCGRRSTTTCASCADPARLVSQRGTLSPFSTRQSRVEPLPRLAALGRALRARRPRTRGPPRWSRGAGSFDTPGRPVYRRRALAGVAQLARACACQAQGRRFDPDHPLSKDRGLGGRATVKTPRKGEGVRERCAHFVRVPYLFAVIGTTAGVVGSVAT